MSSPCTVHPVGPTVRGTVIGPRPRGDSFRVELETGETVLARVAEAFIGADVSVEVDDDGTARIVEIRHRRRLATGGHQ